MIAIISALRSKLDQDNLSYLEAPRATDYHILLFHTEKMLQEFHQLCDRSNATSYQYIDGDTVIMEHTREAAFHAVGAMIAAIDLVCLNFSIFPDNTAGKNAPGPGTLLIPPPCDDAPNSSTSTYAEILPPTPPTIFRSTFCCVRPPGHHASRSKACGFCFFNNVAIGAKYAQTQYGVGKVAVLDFDVHHGNGILLFISSFKRNTQ